eukprot:2624884-Rhodomonas_salina.1
MLQRQRWNLVRRAGEERASLAKAEFALSKTSEADLLLAFHASTLQVAFSAGWLCGSASTRVVRCVASTDRQLQDNPAASEHTSPNSSAQGWLACTPTSLPSCSCPSLSISIPLSPRSSLPCQPHRIPLSQSLATLLSSESLLTRVRCCATRDAGSPWRRSKGRGGHGSEEEGGGRGFWENLQVFVPGHVEDVVSTLTLSRSSDSESESESESVPKSESESSTLESSSAVSCSAQSPRCLWQSSFVTLISRRLISSCCGGFAG